MAKCCPDANRRPEDRRLHRAWRRPPGFEDRLSQQPRDETDHQCKLGALLESGSSQQSAQQFPEQREQKECVESKTHQTRFFPDRELCVALLSAVSVRRQSK